jgi:hypothetical protein
MKTYSIVRVGTEYVVQADDKSVLRVASRRQAARLVSDAVELLDAQPSPPVVPELDAEPSIDRDPRVMPDPRVIPDPRGMPDPEVIPDPRRIPDPSEVP